MSATRNGDPVASVDNIRRSLVLLGALLYPLSDERAALDAGDAESYVDAVAARMRGVCAQSQAILENSLRALTGDAGDTKPRRDRRKSRSPGGLPEDVRREVDRVLVECDVPDALDWLGRGASIGTDPQTPLEELVPLAARVAAAAVRLSAAAAARIDPSTATANGGDADAERAAVTAGGTVRTAQRIARVLDAWDMLADSPTAIIGCPPPPGSAPASSDPRPDGEQTGRRSLGVAAALAGGESAAAGAARSGALRRTRTDAVWSAGGAVQRD
ncbi:MAG: hypothetical protein OXG47_00340 [bacterium]|nr:hypothetical protein [bacterium]